MGILLKASELLSSICSCDINVNYVCLLLPVSWLELMAGCKCCSASLANLQQQQAAASFSGFQQYVGEAK